MRYDADAGEDEGDGAPEVDDNEDADDDDDDDKTFSRGFTTSSSSHSTIPQSSERGSAEYMFSLKQDMDASSALLEDGVDVDEGATLLPRCC